MRRTGANKNALAFACARSLRRSALLCAVSTLFILIFPQFRPPAHAQSPPDATAIIEKVLHQGFSRHNYTLSIQLLRSDPRFLEACLPPYEENGLQFAYLEGKVSWADPDHYDIYLWPKGKSDKVAHFTSEDGFNLSLASMEGFTPAPAGAASPSPTPSAAPSDAPSSTPSGDTTPTPAPSAPPSANPMANVYRYHPLTLLWPFQLKKTPSGVTFSMAGEDTLGSRPCWKLNRNAPDVTMQLWITKDDYSVAQIEYTDPNTGRLDRFNATTFVSMPPDASEPNQVPLLVYSNATVSANGPLCDVSALNAPTAGTPTPSPSATEAPSTQVNKHPSSAREGDQPRLLSGLLLVVVMALLAALVYFGGRYIIFLVSRAMFNKELIVIDEPNGGLSRALQNLGYAVVPASMEILTEERNRLGKKPGAVLPRAVVVAPHCIGLAKNYLFLLKAYVEEGGRVMMFEHGTSDVGTLPFHMYLVPSGGDKVVLQAKQGLWKRLREEDVETKTGHLLPKEFIVEVDHKRPDLDIVQAFNRATGIRATAVGISRSGKGEYMVCQFLIVDDLKKSKLQTSPITKLMLLDLIDYLQGRTKEKEAAAAATTGA